MAAVGGEGPPVIALPTVIGMAVDPGRTDAEATTAQKRLLTEITTLICGQTTMFIGAGAALSRGKETGKATLRAEVAFGQAAMAYTQTGKGISTNVENRDSGSKGSMEVGLV